MSAISPSQRMNNNTSTKDNLNDLDDLRLLSRYHECGCQASFGIICDRHRPALLNFLRKFLGHQKSHAPDIAQETFLRLHSHNYRDRSIPHVKNWLFHVAGNLAVDLKKSAYSRLTCELESSQHGTPDADIQEVAARRELLGKIWIIVEDLDPMWAEAMRLVYRRGLTHTEAAVLMQVPRSTVTTWIQRCLAEVQKHFREALTSVIGNVA